MLTGNPTDWTAGCRSCGRTWPGSWAPGCISVGSWLGTTGGPTGTAAAAADVASVSSGWFMPAAMEMGSDWKPGWATVTWGAATGNWDTGNWGTTEVGKACPMGRKWEPMGTDGATEGWGREDAATGNWGSPWMIDTGWETGSWGGKENRDRFFFFKAGLQKAEFYTLVKESIIQVTALC